MKKPKFKDIHVTAGNFNMRCDKCGNGKKDEDHVIVFTLNTYTFVFCFRDSDIKDEKERYKYCKEVLTDKKSKCYFPPDMLPGYIMDA